MQKVVGHVDSNTPYWIIPTSLQIWIMPTSLHTSTQVLCMHIEPPRTYISFSFSVPPSDLMKSIVVDESLSTTTTRVLFQGESTSFYFKRQQNEKSTQKAINELSVAAVGTKQGVKRHACTKCPSLALREGMGRAETFPGPSRRSALDRTFSRLVTT